MKAWQIGILLFLFSGAAFAVMQQEELSYKDGDVELKGYLFWDNAFSGKRPGILVIHEWWGLNDYAKLRAEMLAEMGYVAFAADMYGDGRNTRHADEARGWMTQLTADVGLWQRRANLALEQLRSHPNVDSAKLAAIGYSFGGASVMQIAYLGADLDGVVSIYGALPPATPEQAAMVNARVLIAHGDNDSFIPPQRIDAFKKALSAAGVDWEMDIYGGAQHGFTNPYADGYGIEGLAYQEQADRRSWSRMLAFFEELFEESY
jgi:dienelactone hydrolase